ncbi:Localization factor PodJS [Caulobacter vibrioides]|uniref:SEL1-like repeat protein n=1 Tax=Caulobacter vibrioides TaxID=155892 RepID=UPI000BB507A9|nr:SEL1-like repeat protein [Caulobacter vibrioides]ATC25002.1 Localization factor PodJS [Caulobacter vibrioides]AZH13155.1 Localization factor PodJS [Caulobacter vibrioides]PLR09781.1 Localization factor PodJS [Caulobacter vibrioides]
MTAASPWSVKGIDPKAREVAKDLARRSGMTLGEWLNRMIIEGDGQTADPRLAGDDVPNRAYLEIVKDDAPPRIEIAEHPADEVGRVALALDRLTQRIEAAEGRNAAAITGIDHSVRDALTRLGASEREQIAVAARFEGAVDELKTEQARATERLRRIESEAAGPRSAEALRALEGALGKVAGHLYEGEARTREAIATLEAKLNQQSSGDPSALVEAVVARLGERLEAAETRTSDALRELGASFQALDQRLGAVETANPATGVQEGLDSLAATLTQKMEAARLEMAAKLRESADGRFDRMERKLGEMAAHVQAAEQRSAQAIERMGREIVGVADAFNRRVHAAESRNASAIEQVGGEVARIAASVEHKLNRADSVQAQALEKLGGEIARITEKLAERIGSAERRNALAIDDVGEQVARVTERLNQRHERSSQELVDRIRQSEERTLRMLEEAREKIDSRLSEAQRKLEAAPPSPPPAQAPAPVATAQRPVPPAASPFEDNYFSQAASFSTSEDEADAFDAPPAPARSFEVAEFPAAEPEEPAFAHDDYAIADGFEPESPRYEVEPEVSDFAPAEPSRPMSTRDIIEQARAAARAAAASEGKGGKAKSAKKEKASKASGALFGGFGGFSTKKSKARLGATVTTALVVFAAAGALGAGVGGLLLLNTDDGNNSPSRVAQAIAGRKADVEVNGPEADTTPGAPRAAVALTTGKVVPAEVEAPAAPPTNEAKALFEDAVRKIESGDRSGVELLKRAANGGYPAAQFYLSKMYEGGKNGVKVDMAEARRWSERAANGGDPRAMHNLALYYFKGEGGPRNSTTAASWFRKAADMGLVDSQFNLAQLYESGLGVSQNPAEAYKWYVIAGRAGDSTARGRATALRSQLTAEAQQTADRSALAFRPQTQVQTASLSTAAPAAANANLGVAQRVLSQLGYYQGPRDGVSSPALRMAIAAYQRDQGLPSTGSVDGETLNRLSVYAR